MKRTSPKGSRASWTSLAIVAPLAATIFLGSVGFAASVKPTDLVASTPAANVQLVANTTAQPQRVRHATVAKAPKPVAQAKQQRRTPPPVHAVTRASGA